MRLAFRFNTGFELFDLCQGHDLSLGLYRSRRLMRICDF
jgi:hypothetical protein